MHAFMASFPDFLVGLRVIIPVFFCLFVDARNTSPGLMVSFSSRLLRPEDIRHNPALQSGDLFPASQPFNKATGVVRDLSATRRTVVDVYRLVSFCPGAVPMSGA